LYRIELQVDLKGNVSSAIIPVLLPIQISAENVKGESASIAGIPVKRGQPTSVAVNAMFYIGKRELWKYRKWSN